MAYRTLLVKVPRGTTQLAAGRPRPHTTRACPSNGTRPESLPSAAVRRAPAIPRLLGARQLARVASAQRDKGAAQAKSHFSGSGPQACRSGTLYKTVNIRFLDLQLSREAFGQS
jgi:hypothetical protein